MKTRAIPPVQEFERARVTPALGPLLFPKAIKNAPFASPKPALVLETLEAV